MTETPVPVLPPSRGDRQELLPYTLLLALALHGLVILGLGFSPRPHRPPTESRPLHVTLVQPAPRHQTPVEDPDLLAQANRRGGGAPQAQRPVRTEPTPPTPRAEKPIPASPLPRPSPRPTPSPKRAEVIRSPTSHTSTRVPIRDLQPRRRRIDATRLLQDVDVEIAQLSQEIERKAYAYAKRPRRKAINASTREYKYATYLEAWRRKVERIGNLNYPGEARRRHLHGNLLLHVAVRADGSIERIQVIRSSGYQVLDDAAKRIVRLAAPFAPFPPEIRKETDILDITRTWQFLSTNRLR